MDTYHVKLGKKRTTVTMDEMISTLLALWLGKAPRSREAHSAVREYFQRKLDEAKDPGRAYVTRWLREETLLDLVDEMLSRKYWKWFDANH